MNGLFHKQAVLCGLLCGVWVGMQLMSPLWAGGGTNGLLSRMDVMVNQMEQSGEMTAEEAKSMRDQVETLRQKVDQRVEENGGWINPVHDKDLYGEIDQYNKPIYDRYQKSKAKKTNNPADLGYPPPKNQ